MNALDLLEVLYGQPGFELFHDGAGSPYIQIQVGPRLETKRLTGAAGAWLGARLRDVGITPSKRRVAELLELLEFEAQAGPRQEAHVRLAGRPGTIHIDLGNDAGQAVEITGEGWRTVTSPPTPFLRPRGMQPLPEPARGGSLDSLEEFINCTEEDWPLILGWLVGALCPTGPSVHLALVGEQGSAKSTAVRLLQDLVDPRAAGRRALPTSERDLLLAARNGWLLPFDNVSRLRPWLSDALCRLSTGAGWSARRMYSMDEEAIIEVRRPVILNGIGDFLERSDLRDRTIICELPRIADSKRVPEARLSADFAAARPQILGALCDALFVGLQRVDEIEIEEFPRMADFARWVAACEPGLGLPEGSFLEAYRANLKDASLTALELNPVAIGIAQLAQLHPEGLELTCQKLGERLAQLPGGCAAPKFSPRALSTEVTRATPDLRRVGIVVERYRETDRNRTRLLRISRRPQLAHPSPVAEEKQHA